METELRSLAATGLPVLDCRPAGAARRAVVVLHDAAGATEHHDDVTRRFCPLGYRAVAPRLYHRTGDGPLRYDDVDGMLRHMRALNQTDLLADLVAVVDDLRADGFGDRSIGLVGFCLGGTIAFLGARHLPLGAAVTFYGGGIAAPEFDLPPLLELAPHLQAPWLGLYGDLDRLAPVDQVEQLRIAAASSEVPTALQRYPDAGHAFHSDVRPEMYHEASARDAWQRTVDWLDRYLEPA